MNKVLDRLRLFLCFFSGEDGFVIRRCRGWIQIYFAVIGIFVILIFIGCFISADSFMNSLIQDAKWVSIPIGIFWAGLVANMYLLLLYTVSPTLLPTGSEKKHKKDSLDEKRAASVVTMILRVGFISLLAIIIAQPLNVLLLSASAQKTIDKQKTYFQAKMFIVYDSSYISEEVAALNEFDHKCNLYMHPDDSAECAEFSLLLDGKVVFDRHYLLESRQILSEYEKLKLLHNTYARMKCDALLLRMSNMMEKELLSDTIERVKLSKNHFENPLLDREYSIYLDGVLSAIKGKTEQNEKIKQLLDKNNFYAMRIKIILADNPWSWAISWGIVLLFLLPIYFKYHIRSLSKDYFEKDFKKNDEMRKVRDELVDPINFPDLQKKILTLNLDQIKTSDFYFQKSLLEYKIVLDDYLLFKKKYAEIFDKKFEQMNTATFNLLLPLIAGLSEVNKPKATKIRKDLDAESRTLTVSKYEYWADHPFKTKRRPGHGILHVESDLIKQLYSENN
jgi:hypothetical protein